MSNFKEQYLIGKMQFTAINDFIAQWHKNTKGMSLPDFLGLTKEEYTLYLQGGDLSLKKELDAQKQKATATFSFLIDKHYKN